MFLIVLIFALFGLIIGSFLNVVILRHGAKSMLGRSGCLSCRHELEAIDLVPIISWLALRGRCRHCGSKISIQYPLVEASTAILFALIGAWAAPQLMLAQLNVVPLLLDYLCIVAVLVCTATYDTKHTIIPDSWVYLFAALALLSQFLIQFFIVEPPGFSILPTLLAGPAAALPFAALWLVSGGRWMGLGDAKLALGIGWLLGPLYSWVAILVGFVLGALIAVCILLPLPFYIQYWLRCAQKMGFSRFRLSSRQFTMNSEIAFGPFLIVGCLSVWMLLLFQIDPLAFFGAGLF